MPVAGDRRHAGGDQRYGPSPQAFLLVPIVGALLIDITNALVIQDFLGLPGSGTRVHALAVLSTARLTTQDLGEARDGLSIPLHEAADGFLGRRRGGPSSLTT